MARSDDSFERLRAAIDELAAADAADLLAEARVEARARVRATLTDALAHSMIERLHEQLPAPARDEPLVRNEPPPRDEAPAREVPPRRNEPPPREKPRAATSPEPSDAPAWYVYGVINADSELTGSLAGVDPAHSVTVLREGELAAVASQVPLKQFDEARLREHLADMAWVEATARAHEAVLDQLCEQVTLIPMRMCTVYRTEGGIREMLSRESEPLLEALDLLDGKAEWGVKVFTDIARAGGGIRHVDTGAGDSPGAAYMEHKRTERERREQAIEFAAEAAAQIHERLGALASDAQVIALQRREASGHQGEMILNGVYLVADDAVPAFHEEVQALRSEFEADAIELVATGPWPAYNFVPGTIGAAW